MTEELSKSERLLQDYKNAVECDSDDLLLIWDEWREEKEREKEQSADGQMKESE